MKKYEFTGETKQIVTINGTVTLHRIKASVTVGNIKSGDIGGWIEKKENLSHDGDAWVSGDAHVYGNARVSGDAWVSGDAQVYGNAQVSGNARVYGDAQVYSNKHVLLVGPIGSRNDYTTFFRNQNRGISVSCGCFLGEIDKFIEKVIETHGENKHASAYRATAELAKLQIDLSEIKEEVKNEEVQTDRQQQDATAESRRPVRMG